MDDQIERLKDENDRILRQKDKLFTEMEFNISDLREQILKDNEKTIESIKEEYDKDI